jgi:hypothetical protein
MALGALGSIFLILGFQTPILYSREKGDDDEMKAATTETLSFNKQPHMFGSQPAL